MIVYKELCTHYHKDLLSKPSLQSQHVPRSRIFRYIELCQLCDTNDPIRFTDLLMLKA